jgi:hypothetical protein
VVLLENALAAEKCRKILKELARDAHSKIATGVAQDNPATVWALLPDWLGLNGESPEPVRAAKRLGLNPRSYFAMYASIIAQSALND